MKTRPASPVSASRLRSALSIVLPALGVNLAMLLLLGVLNADRGPRERPVPPRPVAVTLGRALSRPAEPPSETPDPAPDPIPTIDLDVPAPTPRPVAPVPLALEALSLAPPGRFEGVVLAAATVSRPHARESSDGRRRAGAEAEGAASGTTVDVPPRELPGNPEPRFPREAAVARASGWVQARILIDDQGRVADAVVTSSHGHPAFEGAVLDALPRWRFQPARMRGATVAVWAMKRFRFEAER
jgi:protein TonB